MHDFTLIFEGTSAGLTVHCNPAPNSEALDVLRRHCERRTYMQRAEQWHGLLVRQDDGMPKAGMELRGKWTFDAALDADARAFAEKAHLNPGRKRLAGAPVRKVGRNDPSAMRERRQVQEVLLALGEVQRWWRSHVSGQTATQE